jgi:cyclopropane-fatty-acyl-phospholipid synthase
MVADKVFHRITMETRVDYIIKKGEVQKMYWQEYWAKQVDGMHRWKTEEAYEKMAKEKLFHIEGGDSLLDFGCGSADLLCYYAKGYRTVIGVDFSKPMLENAQKRLVEKECNHVKLLYANDETVWEMVNQKFDRIILNGVVQYLDEKQIENFIKNALKFLNTNGKIALLEIVDPRFLLVFNSGVLSDIDNNKESSKIRIFRSLVMEFFSRILRRLKGYPQNGLGNAYHPLSISKIAIKYNLQMEYVCSMYYEYRYHAILSLKE